MVLKSRGSRSSFGQGSRAVASLPKSNSDGADFDAELVIEVVEVVNLPVAKGKSKRGCRFCSIMFEKQEVHTTRMARTPRLDFTESFCFDVTCSDADLTISVCDEFVEGKKRDVKIIGSIKIRLQSIIDHHQKASDHWYALNPPFGLGTDWKRSDKAKPCGAVHIKVAFAMKTKEVCVEDFELLKILGKGSFGKVLQVAKRDTKRLYAMKVLRKADLIARNEVEHTASECNVLRYCQHPHIVGLKYAFQTADKLFLIMDFVGGGELFFHLKREVRFSEARARLYAAEIVLALEHLHNHGIVYRDLKPENILLDLYGHICLTDFGLCKEDMTHGNVTDTFCGTSEYLAPEVLRRTGHDKAVDWWSFGTLLFEMLVGIPPFYSENTREMFENILYRQLEFPAFVSPQARSLVTELLQRTPIDRLGGGRSDAEEVKSHPFFAEVDWDDVLCKRHNPEFIPQVNAPDDVSFFDEEFTSEDPLAESPHSFDELTIEEQEQFRGFSYIAWSETLDSASNHVKKGLNDGYGSHNADGNKAIPETPPAPVQSAFPEGVPISDSISAPSLPSSVADSEIAIPVRPSLTHHPTAGGLDFPSSAGESSFGDRGIGHMATQAHVDAAPVTTSGLSALSLAPEHSSSSSSDAGYKHSSTKKAGASNSNSGGIGLALRREDSSSSNDSSTTPYSPRPNLQAVSKSRGGKDGNGNGGSSDSGFSIFAASNTHSSSSMSGMRKETPYHVDEIDDDHPLNIAAAKNTSSLYGKATLLSSTSSMSLKTISTPEVHQESVPTAVDDPLNNGGGRLAILSGMEVRSPVDGKKGQFFNPRGID